MILIADINYRLNCFPRSDYAWSAPGKAAIWKSKGLQIPSSNAGPGAQAAQCCLYLGKHDVCASTHASHPVLCHRQSEITRTLSTLNTYLPAMCLVSAAQVDPVL